MAKGPGLYTLTLAKKSQRSSVPGSPGITITTYSPTGVVSNVVAVACRAAADAGIRMVCVTNFSWDFVYAEYVMAAGYHHRSIVWQL